MLNVAYICMVELELSCVVLQLYCICYVRPAWWIDAGQSKHCFTYGLGVTGAVCSDGLLTIILFCWTDYWAPAAL